MASLGRKSHTTGNKTRFHGRAVAATVRESCAKAGAALAVLAIRKRRVRKAD